MAEEVENTEDQESTENLKVLENIDVLLSVEVCRTEITIRVLLRLNEGYVVELDRLAGDPLDIMVNNTKIAKGEVVMVGERFGVRHLRLGHAALGTGQRTAHASTSCAGEARGRRIRLRDELVQSSHGHLYDEHK